MLIIFFIQGNFMKFLANNDILADLKPFDK